MSSPQKTRLGFLETLSAWLGPFALAAGSVGAAEPAAPGVEPAPAAQAQPAEYPHVTLSTWYEVDPQWPQRPEFINWAAVPGVTVDDHDRVWVFTRSAPPVQLYSPEGELIRSWGDDIIGKMPSGLGAHHLKLDSRGMLWLADLANHVVLQVRPDGRVVKTLGTPGEPGCDERHFNKPTDMAITPDGQVYVSDGYGNHRIVHFDAEGKFVKAWGKLGTAPGEFSLPHSIVRDSQGRLYVADRNNVRIQVFDAEGKFLAQWQQLVVPWGLWISPRDEIWVCGCSPMPWRDTDSALSCPPKDQVFMKFDTSGRMLQLWTVPKAEDGQEQPGQLNWVHGIALDSQGNIYATDIIGKRVQKFLRRN